MPWQRKVWGFSPLQDANEGLILILRVLKCDAADVYPEIMVFPKPPTKSSYYLIPSLRSLNVDFCLRLHAFIYFFFKRPLIDFNYDESEFQIGE